MDVFRTDRIRNVVLLGHGGAGKTTLAEAMAYLAGMTNRLGRVEDGNTVSDYDKEEIKRHFSISTTLIPVPWDKVKINVLDTPGYFDFVGEVEEAVKAAGAAIIVRPAAGPRPGLIIRRPFRESGGPQTARSYGRQGSAWRASLARGRLPVPKQRGQWRWAWFLQP